MHPGAHALTTPDKPAYVMAATGETVTYKQLDDESNRIAQLLFSLVRQLSAEGTAPSCCAAALKLFASTTRQ